MDIVSGRKKVAIAWANPKAAGVSMNIDLVQSVAHILVRECLQAKIDVLNDVLSRGSESVESEILHSMIDDLEQKLHDHNEEGLKTKRTFEMGANVKETCDDNRVC